MNKRNATSADVAILAGVSQSTVSRSFDSNSRISEATRQRVFAAAEQLGYQINKAAQTMIKQRSDLVGLVTAGLEDPFRSEFLHKLIAEVQNSGLRPMVMDVSNRQTIDEELHGLIQYQLSGVIITSGTPSESIGKAFIKYGIPVVLINRTEHSDEADIVNLDNESAGAMAAEAFMKSGKTNLIVVRAKTPSFSSVMRAKGFLNYLASHVSNDEIQAKEVLCESGNYDGGYQVAKEILASAYKPDGVFFCMDHIACGFLDAAKQLITTKDMEDIGVIGCDDIALARFKAYDLTTVRQPSDEIAKAALQTLLNRLKHPTSVPTKQAISAELVYRSTLAKPITN
ncbi:LacI family DNA-binding transcriptional regulator [Marinomonas rhizomae]|uniref:LacI family DNA-binding transcriptional regulator n=1 Tax=Marinomonas rhizomae TaxID=491948 RepID=UPI00210285C9|nr:LacI family DNA-binding transcriptional regulator [Marinomonas rhizomae]UTV99709.1 LacI family DNA-binding transcriptional regulator [Marinomonas rhizomae]